MKSKKTKVILSTLAMMSSVIQGHAADQLEYSSLGTGEEIREGVVADNDKPQNKNSQKNVAGSKSSKNKCSGGSCGDKSSKNKCSHGDKSSKNKCSSGGCGDDDKSSGGKCSGGSCGDKSSKNKCSSGGCGDDKSSGGKCSGGSCGDKNNKKSKKSNSDY